MDHFTPGQITRTVNLLVNKLDITSRDDLVALLSTVDKSRGAEVWKGVGDVREDIVEALLALSPEEFTLATGLPEHDEQPAVLPQDSPGPSLAGSIAYEHMPPIENGEF